MDRGRPEPALPRFRRVREALNADEEEPQYDPELELLTLAAQIASGTDVTSLDRALADVNAYVRARGFRFHEGIAEGLADPDGEAVGRLGLYSRTMVAWSRPGRRG